MKISETLDKLHKVRKYINHVILERESETDSALVAVMSGASCLFIGDAGAAKTEHIHVLSEMLGLRLFDTLMSESTKPETIFGPVDVPALAKGIQRNKIDGYAPTAELLFFDEVFKANAVVLNPLLWLLNEHKFRNGDEGVIQCPTISVFAASNEIPTDVGSRPIYDRFLLRHEVKYIKSATNMGKLFERALGNGEFKRPEALNLSEVEHLQRVTKRVKVSNELWDTMVKTRNQIKRSVGVEISDRRLAKSVRLVQATALLHKRSKATHDDLEVLANVFWDTPDQIRKVRSIVVAQSGVIKGDLLSYVETAESVYDKAIKTGSIKEAFGKLKNILKITKKFSTANGKKIHQNVLDYAIKLRDMLNERKVFNIVVMQDENAKDWFKLSEASSNMWTPAQLRSVGFKWKRTLGYWHIPPSSSKIMQKKISKRIEKVLKVKPTFTDIMNG